MVAQFEEKASVPVDVAPSSACENAEPEIVKQPDVSTKILQPRIFHTFPPIQAYE